MSQAYAAHDETIQSGVPNSSREALLARLGLHFTNWPERWFPDAYVFVCLAVAVVAAVAMLNGAAQTTAAKEVDDASKTCAAFTDVHEAFEVSRGVYFVAACGP
jgi:short-chain fatty acids transporter